MVQEKQTRFTLKKTGTLILIITAASGFISALTATRFQVEKHTEEIVELKSIDKAVQEACTENKILITEVRTHYTHISSDLAEIKGYMKNKRVRRTP